MRRVALLALAVGSGIALLPRAARAEGPGPIGITRNVQLGLHLGMLESEVLADDVDEQGYSTDGPLYLLRFRGGASIGPTHYGHRASAEATIAVGWIDRAAFVRPLEPPGKDPVWGRLFLDFDTLMSVALIDLPAHGSWPALRLSPLVGYGISTDFATLFVGARGAAQVESVQVELEYQRRWGDSFSAPSVREERAHAYGFWGHWGLGVEIWHGYSEDASGRAATDRVLRGGYRALTANLAWVPR